MRVGFAKTNPQTYLSAGDRLPTAWYAVFMMAYGKAVNMFVSINPQNEERRALAMLDSFTDHKKAAELFSRVNSQGEKNQAEIETSETATNENRAVGRSRLRFFNANRPTRALS